MSITGCGSYVGAGGQQLARSRRSWNSPGCTSYGLGDSALEMIRGWFVGTEVKEIAKLTHLLTTGINELRDRPVPASLYTDRPDVAARLTTLANSVNALRDAFVQTMKPYLPADWAPSWLPSLDIWRSYAINVTDAKAVETVLRQQFGTLQMLARQFESITGIKTNVPGKEPELRASEGLVDLAVKVAGWGLFLGLIWYGGRALIRVGESRYTSPPRYATRR